MNLISKKCLNCDSIFEIEYKRRDTKFCGRNCYFEYAKKNETIGRNKDISIYEYRTCKVCDTQFEVKKKDSKSMCSNECRKKWALIPKNKEDRINKSKLVINNKYGVDSIFKLKNKQLDIKTIIKNKYGVENVMQNKKIVDKLKNTIRNNQVDKIIPKLAENNLKLLDNYITNKDHKNNTSISYDFECLKCNNIFNSTVLGSGKIPICRSCYPIQKNSSLELIISNFLSENNIKYKLGDRTVIKPMELDIFIEEKNIAFEINGNYWHTELFGGKYKQYHIEKTEKCNDVGIKLIHIFEDELLFKKDIVMSRIKNYLGITDKRIYARNCIIKEVSFNDKKIFLNDNHTQGNSIDKIRLGLYYNDELISVMTFSSLRKALGQNKTMNSWELTRFASKINTSVVGGFSKLISAFINGYNPHKIITYADIRWSGLNENVYGNQFKFIGKTTPNYWYVKKGQYLHRNHRYRFRKDVLVSEGFSTNKTEWEIMQEKGYDRIWDCGNLKYEFVVVPTGASFDDI